METTDQVIKDFAAGVLPPETFSEVGKSIGHDPAAKKKVFERQHELRTRQEQFLAWLDSETAGDLK